MDEVCSSIFQYVDKVCSSIFLLMNWNVCSWNIYSSALELLFVIIHLYIVFMSIVFMFHVLNGCHSFKRYMVLSSPRRGTL